MSFRFRMNQAEITLVDCCTSMAAKRIQVGILQILLRRSQVFGNHCIRRKLSTAAVAGGSDEKWRLLSAVCVERWPVVTQKTQSMEDKFSHLIQQIELENSLLSDHEMRHRLEVQQEKKEMQEDLDQMDIGTSTQTALDLEDQWEAESKEFQPADRITEADRTRDMTSVERKLDEKLILVVKQKIGDKFHWVFPQGEWREGESMRETAERVLGSHCGETLSAQFIGHAPSGVYKYTFKTNQELGTGAKVFFFKASYKDGDVKVNSDAIQDHMWLTKQELKKYLHDNYFKSVYPFILEL